MPRVFLGRVASHLANDGPLNPYFQGGCGSVIDPEFFLPQNCLIIRFP